jgi:hypothetical protein
MATNYRDPRYQKAMLRAQANPVGTQGATDAVTSQHALNEVNIHNQFKNLETSKRDFKSSLGLSRGRLNLAKKQLKIDAKHFAQGLKDSRQDLNRTMLLGLGTAGWSFMEGRRRATLRREDIARDKKRHEEIMKHIGSKA